MGLNVKLFKEEKRNIKNIYIRFKKLKKIIFTCYLNFLFFTNNYIYFMHAFNKDLGFLINFTKQNLIFMKKVSHISLNNYFKTNFFVSSLNLIFMNNFWNFLNMFYILKYDFEKYDVTGFKFFIYVNNRFYSFKYINLLFKLNNNDSSLITMNDIYLNLFKTILLPFLQLINFYKNLNIVLYYNLFKICQQFNN